MIEYIPKQGIIDEIEEWKDLYPDSATAREALSMLERSVKKMPAANVKPVLGGHWILLEDQRKEDNDNGNYLFECSECGHRDVHAENQEVPFCWYCGADMRGSL